MQSSSVAVEVFTGEQLRGQVWMPDLVSMVNEAYSIKGARLFPPWRRIDSNHCLSEGDWNTGLVAVAFKVVKDQLTKLHVKREIVAIASAKQWFASNPLIEDEVKMNPRVYRISMMFGSWG